MDTRGGHARSLRPENTEGYAKHALWLQAATNRLTGRLKVFSQLNDWFEGFNLYHRKDGLIVKLNDDLLSAIRYAVMMKRYARTQFESKAAKYAHQPMPSRHRGDGLDWMDS